MGFIFRYLKEIEETLKIRTMHVCINKSPMFDCTTLVQDLNDQLIFFYLDLNLLDCHFIYIYT